MAVDAAPADLDPVRLTPMADAVEDVAWRLLRLVVPVWLLPVIAAALSGDTQWHVGTVLPAVALAALGYALFLRSRRPAELLLPLLLSAVWLAWNAPMVDGQVAEDLILEHWVNLTCWSAGIVLVPVALGAGTVLAVVVGVSGAALLMALVHGVDVQLESLIALCAYGLTDGFAAVAAFGVMRRSARRSDLRIARSVDAAASLTRRRAQRAESQRLARVMHDTVVNTLGAVRSWQLDHPAAFSARAAADLRTLRELDVTATTDPSDVVQACRQRARLLGLELQVRPEPRGRALPAEVAAAIQGACWEALNNVAKHAGTREVELEWHEDGDALCVMVRDHGRGFDAAAHRRNGSSGSVIARCAEVGVLADIASSPGAGTEVCLRWDPSATVAAEPAQTSNLIGASVERDLSASVGWIALVLGLFSMGAQLRIGLGEGSWAGLAAVLVLVPIAWATRRVHRGEEVLRAPLVLYIIGGALVVAAPSWGVEGCMRVGTWWFGPFASLVLGAYVAILDARRVAVIATVIGTCLGYLTALLTLVDGTPKCAQDTLAAMVLQGGLIVALGGARSQHERIHHAGLAALRAGESDHVAAVRESETLRLRRQQLQVARSIAEPVLAGLADGSLDPGDPAVREQAGAAESTLRLLTTLPGSGLGDLSEVLAGQIVVAHQRGVRLHVNFGYRAEPGAEYADHVRRALQALLAAAPPGAAAQVTFLGGEGGRQLLGVLHASPRGDALMALRDAGWTVSRSESELLLELTLERTP